MPRKGQVKNSIKGMVNYNNFGSKMIVSEDRGDKDIDVYFPEYDWTFKHARRGNFNRGFIKCPYEPRVYNVGYIGEGKYKTRIDGKKTKCYVAWNGMIRRCYDKKYQEKHITYRGCKVCDEWLNYQNFAKWYYENYYEINNETMCLDKDILIKGNKIYSPEACIFVPNRINVLFTKSDKSRGDYPIGVKYRKGDSVLEVLCSIYENDKKKKVYLGIFPPNQSYEAFLCYKQFKEAYIKQVADEYKYLIPQKLYDALYRYEVEIDD